MIVIEDTLKEMILSEDFTDFELAIEILISEHANNLVALEDSVEAILKESGMFLWKGGDTWFRIDARRM